MARECDRCGGDAESFDKLPFKQFWDEYGRHPTLCQDCRQKLVMWIERGSE